MNLEKISEEFESISSHQWKELITKELGKPLAESNWIIEPGLEISPFVHPDDLDFLPFNLENLKKDQDWKSAEYYNPQWEYLNHPDIFFLTDSQKDNPQSFPKVEWRKIYKSKLHQSEDIKSEFISSGIPSFFDQVNSNFVLQPKNYTRPGSESILIKTYFEEAFIFFGNPENAASKISVRLILSDHFFLNIARIRAVYLLWYEMFQTSIFPEISAITSPILEKSNPYEELISLTLKASSAAIGGANVIVLSNPFELAPKIEDQSNGRRLAYNIHQILKWEVGLNQHIDPAHGSFYLELLTRKIVDFTKRSL